MFADYSSIFKKPAFYLAIVSCLLAGGCLFLYLTEGKTQYNSQMLSQAVLIGLIAGIALLLAFAFTGIRFLAYGGAVMLLYGFLELAITEINFWSNWIIATDPVEPAVLQQYFLITGLALGAVIFGFLVTGLAKGAYYRKEAK